MGEAKIRKAKGEYPVVDNASKGHIDDKSRILAQKRCKPLPVNNTNYHFPKMIDKKDCLVFCTDFCDSDYKDHYNETVGLGEMAAHIIMSGGHIIFASSIDGERLLRQVMIPACNKMMLAFGTFPNPDDYEIRLSGDDKAIQEYDPSWDFKNTQTGQSFAIKDNFGATRAISYLSYVDVYGEFSSYDKWKYCSELPHVKDAKERIKKLGVECSKYGFDAMLSLHKSFVDACKNGEFCDPSVWRRMSNIIEREWDGIGDWLA